MHENTDSQLPTIGWENLAALEMGLMVRDEIARPTTRILFVPTTTGKPMTYWVLRHLLRRLRAQAGVKVWPITTSGGALHVHWANEGGNDCLGMARRRWSWYWRYTRSVSLEPINQLRWMGGQVPKVGVEPTRAEAHCALNAARLPVPPLRRRAILPCGVDISRQLEVRRVGPPSKIAPRLQGNSLSNCVQGDRLYPGVRVL